MFTKLKTHNAQASVYENCIVDFYNTYYSFHQCIVIALEAATDTEKNQIKPLLTASRIIRKSIFKKKGHGFIGAICHAIKINMGILEVLKQDQEKPHLDYFDASNSIYALANGFEFFYHLLRLESVYFLLLHIENE